MKINKEPERLAILFIQEKEWQELKDLVQKISHQLDERHPPTRHTLPVISEYIKATEFMKAVGIGRSLFDNLIKDNKIKTIKKRRKIYVLATEINRYFSDPSI